ncbi:MAG: crotonase/enoyl-CoA hydratase family protein [Myxococcales bacterium]|nr:crotonase/enoyl-CoA hydratase family protein [Myxococcales bacterium]
MSDSHAPHLLVEKEGHIVTVTMNRPEAKNAFSLEMMARMADAWQMIDDDPEVRVAILTGASGTFSAGADLKLMHADQSNNPFAARFAEDPDLHWKALLRHHRLSKPLIAAVEGFALGGGTEILQATEIRVAGESAKFGVTEAQWGLFPLGGSSVRLQRQVPFTKAMEILLMARPIAAKEAAEIGLIGRVVPDGDALAEAKRIAGIIASNGPLAVQALLKSTRATADLSEEEALKVELKIGWPIINSKDAKEGTRAFAEKRKPDFKGEL